uniref:Uncharacterized protein n=1 Tax=Solanum lycopersicum TaxID=4081 RepID=A0A3Q7G3K6_SOLLC
MGDAYWNRQPQLPQSAGLLKRPRTEYVPDIPQSGMPSAHEVHHYLGRNDDREGPRVVDTQSFGSAYDRSVPRVVDTESIGSAYDRYLQSSQLSSLPVGEANNNYKGVGLVRAGGGGIPTLAVRDPLPSARGPELAPNGRAMVFSGQLPVEPMPRPRYKMDEHDHDSAYLRLQFSKFPGPSVSGNVQFAIGASYGYSSNILAIGFLSQWNFVSEMVQLDRQMQVVVLNL